MFSTNKNSIGIDVADRTIEVVELSKDGKDIKVVNTNRVKLKSGIVERGRIRNEKKLLEAVKKLFQKAKPNQILAKQIILGLPESQVYIHTFNLKSHDIKEREALVLKEAQTNIPIHENKLVFSYRELYKNRKEVGVILVASSSEVVSEWQNFFKKLDINIGLFGIEPIATFRGLSSKSFKKPVAIIDIGSATTHIAIFNKDGLLYSHSVNIAGFRLTQEVMNSLKKSEAEAEKLKIKEGLFKSKKATFNKLTKVLDLIIEDIKKTFAYFEKQTGEAVMEIILVGGSSKLKGLSKYFSKSLNTKIKIGKQDIFKSISSSFYIEAIGLALRTFDEKHDKNDPAFLPLKEDELINESIDSEKGFLSKKELKPKKNLINDGSSSIKLHVQKMILVGLIVIAFVVVPAAYKYSNNQKIQQEIKVQLQLKELDFIVQDHAEKYEMERVELEELEKLKVKEVVITEIETGWLNVRKGPGIDYSKITKIYPGETYPLLQEKNNWYNIKITPEKSVDGEVEVIEGWITSQYADIK